MSRSGTAVPAAAAFRSAFDRAPADGRTNMRRDAAMLADAAAGAPPSLRLYRWTEPTLTVGHSQRPERVCDPRALADRGVPWVRRPSGGRALLHLPDELTYAFAAHRERLPPAGSPGAGRPPRVRAAYALVMTALREGLAGFVRLDPPAPAGREDGGDPRRPCQAVATGHELGAGGRKLVTGAQRWRRGAFLQHGSIPWTLDPALTNALAGLPEDEPLTAVGLADLVRPAPAPEAVAEALIRAFRQVFGGEEFATKQGAEPVLI